MKCPVCKADTLSEIVLLEGLPAHQCSNCDGVWMPSNTFLTWKRTQPGDFVEKQGVITIDPDWEVNELKLCPGSGHILTRYKIFPDSEFHLDRCRHCNGIWFDKQEWNVLLDRNLHDNLNEFFTHVWQDKLHDAETKKNMEKLYLQKFGDADYEYVQKVREWLKDHPKRGMLLAFLQADDPYKV
jgi:Zn-finger nucleic acid-binding protein